ncbi:SLC13 family permease [Nonomuraea sp. KM88]|uniref:SLC13 family permease n=1 Tax=Nonomuraea sp. KM88 TaxID=3457427 RepID=UPI003FCC57D7
MNSFVLVNGNLIAILGFLTIGLFLVLTMTRRVSVLTALVLVPVVTALVGGFAAGMGPMILEGLGKVAPTGIMIAFAVLYFSLMIDTGLFDPLIRGILRLAKDDPLRIAVGTAVLTMCVALDGDGASTFLITVSALLPVYKRLNMSPLVLTGVVCLGAGVMNMVPWGGPTARAMAVLKLDSSEVFAPVLPAMAAGIVWAGGGVPDRAAGTPPPGHRGPARRAQDSGRGPGRVRAGTR